MRSAFLVLAFVVIANSTEAVAFRRSLTSADPFLPSASQAVRLVRNHVTNGYETVAQTLAYAQQVRSYSFRMDRIWTEHREGEPFTRVHLCYLLRNPGARSQPICGIDYIVAVNPTHVELAQPWDGLSRDLQAGRDQFVRAIDRELALQRRPVEKAFRDFLNPINPYDWR